MKLAVVAELNFFDNVINQKAVYVEDDSTWKDAYIEFTKKNGTFNDDYIEWIGLMSDNFDEAREEFANGEMEVSIIYPEPV